MLLAKFIHINMDKIKRPKLYTLPDTLRRQSSAAAVPIASRGMVCLAFGTACPAACDVQAVRVRWGAGVSTGGVYSRHPAPPGE